MLSAFEQQPLQRPVKIASFVYCVFDPLGEQTGNKPRNVLNQWIVFRPEKSSHTRYFLILECCLSRELVSFYSLISCYSEAISSEQRAYKGKVEVRREVERVGMK